MIKLHKILFAIMMVALAAPMASKARTSRPVQRDACSVCADQLDCVACCLCDGGKEVTPL